ASVLDPAGYPLTSANNILVLGSDRRQKDSKEPHANTHGPSRSDSIMLIRTGGGHAARLSIPRDTVVEIPGHGLQKINAAYAFGGPALSISVIKRFLGIPINHVVEVNFENFPQLIDAMSGVNLLALFASFASGGTPPTRILKPSGSVTLPDGEVGLTVSESARREAVRRFESG